MHFLLKAGIHDNHWLAIHILLGGILAKILIVLGMTPQVTLIQVGLVTVAYEIFQWFYDAFDDKRRMIVDSVADIGGAWIMALIVVV